MRRIIVIITCFVFSFMVFSQAYADDFVPGKKLKDDLAKVKINIVKAYRNKHPRLLFYKEDREELRRKISTKKEVWDAVLKQADGIGSYVPSSNVIRSGAKYWRIEWVFSGALANFVTGKKKYKTGAIKWMIAHCKENVWGTGWKERANIDLEASWYLYFISLAYDILYPQLTQSEKSAIRNGLVSHARAIYKSLESRGHYSYDQNHTYIPAIALATASFALLGEVKETDDWLKLSYAILKRCRYVLGEDGYYYEGYGYWGYALHWHVRYADILSRATGKKAHDLPILKKNCLFALHLSLPDSPFSFDIGDCGSGSRSRPLGVEISWNSMLYRLAKVHKDGRFKTMADKLADLSSGFDDPGMHFLWYCPDINPVPFEEIPTYHYFDDHDIVCWRSSWDKDATVYMFKCGPPQGHKATKKLKQLRDWTMNSGHVHPDMGMFWMYAKGQYLAVDTGYTASKRTDDHNTLLVGKYGQAKDGKYHVYAGLRYKKFDAVKIKKVHLEKKYGYAMGDLSSAYCYPRTKIGKVSLHRHVIMTKRFLIVFDDISSDKSHEYSWLLHSDADFKGERQAIVTEPGEARLLTYVLAPKDYAHKIGPTYVQAGKSPDRGKKEKRGYQLTVKTSDKVNKTKFLVVLIPATKTEKNPFIVMKGRVDNKVVEVEIIWSDMSKEKVKLDLSWQTGSKKGPVVFSMSGK